MSESFEKLPVGTKVQAVWSEDGEWYVVIRVITVFSSVNVIHLHLFYLVFSFCMFLIVKSPGMMQKLRH